MTDVNYLILIVINATHCGPNGKSNFTYLLLKHENKGWESTTAQPVQMELPRMTPVP